MPLAYPPNTRVWVKVQEGKNGPVDWVAAEIMESTLDATGTLELTVVEDESQVRRKIIVPASKLTNEHGDNELTDVKLRNTEGQSPIIEGHEIEDLITLTHLHEPSILYSLEKRYDRDEIYTYTGSILIAINPFFRIPMYSDEHVKAYQRDGHAKVYDPDHVSTLPPHAYAIADAAFNSMAHPNSADLPRNQSILVSGESGAGKTETTKIVMQYLATVAGTAPGAERKEGGGTLEQQVIKSNPILEAFGNARTVRNDNSSRFGKFIEIQFDAGSRLVGSAVRTFLLEKVRLVFQNEGERNYHVFYMMDAGADEQSLEKWRLNAISEYDFTSQSGCYERQDGVADADEYDGLRQAMSVMGFSDDEQEFAFQTSAAVLTLGNMAFAGEDDGQTVGGAAQVDKDSQGSLEDAAALLHVTPQELENAMTTRKITAGLDVITTKLNPEQTAVARDGLVKAIYSSLFEWVVTRVNECIKVGRGSRPAHFIGLLDIFGFESFKHNGFEQFLINYANEVLQNQFNKFVFEMEQEEYTREQISWSFVSFPDNKRCIEMIESRSIPGVLPLLEEACTFPGATDSSFSSKIHDNLGNHEHFVSTTELKVAGDFVVKHYAGQVRYHTTEFIDKNKDKLYQEGITLLAGSTSEHIKALAASLEGDGSSDQQPVGRGRRASVAGSSPPRPRAGTSPARRAGGARSRSRSIAGGGGGTGGAGGGGTSLCTQFKDSLRDLVDQISQTTPHYIRCLKPNDDHVQRFFDGPRIAEQLRYGGVLEAVKVARAGFPVRMRHNEFVQRYKILAAVRLERIQATHKDERERAKAGVRVLLEVMLGDLCKVDPPPSEAKAFEEKLAYYGLQLGTTKVFFRQSAFDRTEHLRTRMTKRSAVKIQSVYRRFRVEAKWRRQRHASIKIQKRVRMLFAARFVQKLRERVNATRIQTKFRQLKALSEYHTLRSGVIKLQANFRAKQPRQKFIEVRHLTRSLRIQTWLRMRVQRRRFRRHLFGVIYAQNRWRAKVARRRVKDMRREARSTQALQGQVEQFQSMVADNENQRKALETRAQEALQLLEMAEMEAQKLRQENETFKKQLVEKKANDGAVNEREEEARLAELLQLRTVNEELSSKLQSLEAEAAEGRGVQEQVRSLTELLQEKDRQLEQSKKAEAQLKEVTERTKRVKEELSDATAANNDDRVRELEREVEQLKAERVRLTEVKDSKESKDLRRQRSDLAVQLQRAKLDAEDREQELARERKEMEELRKERDSLAKLAAEKQSSMGGATTVASQEIESLLATNKALTKELEKAQTNLNRDGATAGLLTSFMGGATQSESAESKRLEEEKRRLEKDRRELEESMKKLKDYEELQATNERMKQEMEALRQSSTGGAKPSPTSSSTPSKAIHSLIQSAAVESAASPLPKGYAKCQNCGVRIPIDQIFEHSESCESDLPDVYSPASMTGSTTRINGKNFVVHAQTSTKSSQAMTISILADVGSEGQSNGATWVVERTEAQLMSLHGALRKELKPFVLTDDAAQLPVLPPLTIKQEPRDLRAVERYLICLLELDDKWVSQGQQPTLQGLQDMLGFGFASSNHKNVVAFINSHAQLMQFLDATNQDYRP